MRGSVHAAIGASIPAGPVLGGSIGVAQGLAMAAISAGFALLPDLDHPDSIASKAFGKRAHKVVRDCCMRSQKLTSTKYDQKYIAWRARKGWDTAHRTLTHTTVVALVLMSLTYAISSVSIVAMSVLAGAGTHALHSLHRTKTAIAVLGAILVSIGAATLLNPWLMALAVGGGYFSHIVADACTTQGVPVFWPLSIKGKRWWNVRLLGSRVRSGGKGEEGPALGVALASNGLLMLLMF